MRRRVSMYQKTAWQSLKSVASGVFNPLVKEVERLVFPGETGVCYSINKSKILVSRSIGLQIVHSIFND